jgi:dethiobiotin synthetase
VSRTQKALPRAQTGLFITGTDTGVGKTSVACFIARTARDAGLTVGLYKPVCSGSAPDAQGEAVWADVERLTSAVDHAFPRNRICPQCFAAPLAPPIAARREGRAIDAALLRDGAAWWAGRVDLLLVEGAGGLLAPLTDDETVADLAADLGYPLLIVAADRLGTINHALLTIEAARRRGLTVAGVVLSRVSAGCDASTADNATQIQRRCEAPVLGILEFGEREMLLPGGGTARINWADLAARAP